MATVLFRKSLDTEDEYNICGNYFEIARNRYQIRDFSVVIPRYSSLPFYEELQSDMTYRGNSLIQSYKQHKYIADFQYYDDITEYTFKTWRFGDKNIPDIPLVVKGVTNSKKWNWNSLMFAKNRTDAMRIAVELSNDGLIGYQDIILREYVPLKKIEHGINGLPFSNEYRFFFYKGQEIASGFYWSIAEEAESFTAIPESATILANKISDIVKHKTSFYVIDVAEKQNGGWICVELNCGTMSGLSMIDPNVFYKNLARIFS